ncbi:MAG: M48 family metalloprotease [Sideroxydans sp.]|nr:M48 family metalloprotease [Sideroxydans sp.]
MNAKLKWVSLSGLLLIAMNCSAFDLRQSLKDKLNTDVPQINPKLVEAVNVVKEARGPDEEEEIAIGRQISGNLLGAAPLVKDAKLQKYVNQVGEWVASQSERPDLPWHFGVIQSEDVNAFAAPGGYVFVTLGLYRLLQNEADLAGVLGHEIGHVIRKHHLKILQQSQLVDAGGKLLSRQVGGDDKIQNLIGNGAEIVARGLDKDAEFEADRIGVVLATRAGYDAYGLPGVLQQIGHFAKDDGSIALLFKTHPLPDDRLDKLDSAMEDRFDRIKGQTLEKRFYRVKK